MADTGCSSCWEGRIDRNMRSCLGWGQRCLCPQLGVVGNDHRNALRAAHRSAPTQGRIEVPRKHTATAFDVAYTLELRQEPRQEPK